MQRRIAIIGTGYVGLTVGICLASLGHKITCVDKDKAKVRDLRQGRIPIYEPGLSDLLKQYQKNIAFTTNIQKAVQQAEVVFLCVGTPSNQSGAVDMAQFQTAIKQVAQSMDGYKVIVNKSTVPLGTADWVSKEVKKYYKGRFDVVSNPEFLREGSAVQDFLQPDRIIIGTESKKAEAIMEDIYSSIKAPKIVVDPLSSELIKYSANAFLATKISFINEIANICDKTGADVEKVALGIGSDNRIGPKFLRAGVGWGGSCFPKDIQGLMAIAEHKGYDFKLLKAVIQVNEQQKQGFAAKIKQVLKQMNGATVAVWGLAFKPQTDDVRNSPAVDIINMLLEDGCKIKAYDPIAIENAKKALPKNRIEFCNSALEAVQQADVLALITAWPEFSEADMKQVKQAMAHPAIVDGRNLFNPKEIRALGFIYHSMGRV